MGEHELSKMEGAMKNIAANGSRLMKNLPKTFAAVREYVGGNE
jgi:hypothetical protein